jgi:hypothetical protein
MKDKILKIAGVKSEAAFYKKFPTEAAFKKAHGKELKKAQLGASVAPEIGSYMGGERVNNSPLINYSQLYDNTDLSITGMNEQKRMQAQNLAAQREIAAKTGQGGGGGLQDLIKGIGSAASAMGKNGKRVKRAQLGLNDPIGGSMPNPNPNPYAFGSPSISGQSSAPENPYGQLPVYDQSQMAGQNAKQSPFANIAKGIPVVGKLVGAFQANAAEKKAMKLADQTSKVSGIARQAADTRPEETRRRYVRPEDMAFGTQEMGSAYGTGTNYLSRNGSVIGGNPTEIQNTYAPNYTLYDDLGYEPLEDSDQVKQYRRGGLVQAQGGFMNQFSKFATSPQGGNVLNQAGTLAGGNNAGSQFGDAIGDAVKFIPGIGPIASAAIKPIANLVGGLLDKKPKKTAAFNAQTQANTQNIAFTSGVRGIQGQNQAFMQMGGELLSPPSESLSILEQNAADALKYPSNYRKDIKTGIPIPNVATTIPRPGGGFDCPPGYTKYKYADGTFSCILTNESDKTDTKYMGLTKVADDIQYSAIEKPALAIKENGGWVSNDWQPQVIAKFGDHTAEDYYDAGHEGMDSLRAGGHLSGDYTPPSERAMQTYAMGGELKTHWGGYAEPISYNPYLPDGGETVMFRGQSHDESDGKGRTGIGVTYGKKEQDSYTDYAEYGAEADADVEVERNEPAVKLKDGTSGEDSLVVYGNLKIPNQYLDVIGDDKAKGKKFKSYIKDLSKVEDRQNKIMEKSLKMIDNGDDSTAFGQLAFATAKAMNQGANMKLKEIAEKKQNAASLQSALNDTAAEYGVVADDLARGKIKIDKSNNIMAKFGASVSQAQKGTKVAPGAYQFLEDKATHDRRMRKEAAAKAAAKVPALSTPKYIGREETLRREDPDEVNFYAAKRAAAPDYVKMMAERVGEIKQQILPGKKLPGTEKNNGLVDTAMLAYNEVLPYLRPNYKIDQPDFSSEMMAAGMNQMDPVQAQLFTPNLTQPYSVSFQDQLNANQADFNALQRMTGYNPAAQSALAAQKYAANSTILGGQFRANQAERARAYEENRKLLDQSQLGNLGILDKQYERQATAKSRTKAQSIEIAKSISDKLAQAKKEQRISDLAQQRYNFRFDANGRPINMNPLATFNMYGSGKPSMGGYDLEEGKDFTYNRAGKIVGTRALKKDEDAKNGNKIKARNGSIVKAIKNL